MVVRFQIDDEHRRRVEQALALIDVAKTRRRKKRMAEGYAKAKRRHAERKAARKVERKRLGGNEFTQKLPLAGWKVLLARMASGTWYSFAEMRALVPEFASGSVHVYVYQKIPRLFPGFIERAGNPDCDLSRPHAINATGRYLYRMSAEAEITAAEWRLQLGECPGPDLTETAL